MTFVTLSGSLGLVGSKVGYVVLNSFTMFNMFNTFPKALINCTNDKSEKIEKSRTRLDLYSRPFRFISLGLH